MREVCGKCIAIMVQDLRKLSYNSGRDVSGYSFLIEEYT